MDPLGTRKEKKNGLFHAKRAECSRAVA
jgi:hypothetical protein